MKYMKGLDRAGKREIGKRVREREKRQKERDRRDTIKIDERKDIYIKERDRKGKGDYKKDGEKHGRKEIKRS